MLFGGLLGSASVVVADDREGGFGLELSMAISADALESKTRPSPAVFLAVAASAECLEVGESVVPFTPGVGRFAAMVDEQLLSASAALASVSIARKGCPPLDSPSEPAPTGTAAPPEDVIWSELQWIRDAEMGGGDPGFVRFRFRNARTADVATVASLAPPTFPTDLCAAILASLHDTDCKPG